MARDIAGMLTGVSNQSIDPNMSSEQQWTALNNQSIKGMQGAIQNLRGQPRGTQAEQLQMAMASLDPSNPADAEKLIKLMMATGDRAGAAKLAASLKATQQDTATRSSLIRKAQTMNRPDIVEYLESGADTGPAFTELNKSISITAPLEREREVFDEVLDRIEAANAKEKGGVSAWFKKWVYDKAELSTGDRTLIFAKAKELMGKQKGLGYEAAVVQAMQLSSPSGDLGSSSQPSVSTKVSTSADPYSNAPILSR